MELWLAYSVALGKWIGRVELWRGDQIGERRINNS
jgi:hypothetical protein